MCELRVDHCSIIVRSNALHHDAATDGEKSKTGNAIIKGEACNEKADAQMVDVDVVLVGEQDGKDRVVREDESSGRNVDASDALPVASEYVVDLEGKRCEDGEKGGRVDNGGGVPSRRKVSEAAVHRRDFAKGDKGGRRGEEDEVAQEERFGGEAECVEIAQGCDNEALFRHSSEVVEDFPGVESVAVGWEVCNGAE